MEPQNDPSSQSFDGPAQELKTSKPANKKLNLNIDLRIIIAVLLVAIAVMLFIWKPWVSAAPVTDKTITVTGETTVTAKPDQFVFHPRYQYKNASKDVAIAELTKKSNEIVAKLKSLGVDESKIKTNSSGYDYSSYYDSASKTSTYTLSLTVTAGDSALAQKVQDYLITTSPTGSVSPQASFSTKKRKDLQNQARGEATKDARAKADQMAKNLGFKVGKVKSVDDDGGLGGDSPMYAADSVSSANKVGVTDDSLGLSYTIQPGENDLSYSISVVYYIR